MESNHPGVGLPPPAGFEDRMGHQTPAAPRARVAVGLGDPSNFRDLMFPLQAPVVFRVHGVDHGSRRDRRDCCSVREENPCRMS